MVNYGRELRMGANIRKKEKIEKATEFAERMKRKKAEKWKKRDKVILNMKDLVFKERSVRKLVDQYIGSYIIDKIVFTNAVKLRLPTLMRIHLVVNIS